MCDLHLLYSYIHACLYVFVCVCMHTQVVTDFNHFSADLWHCLMIAKVVRGLNLCCCTSLV